MGWDPSQYLAYGDERSRPAMDLLARVPTAMPRLVADLGCGPGNSTALLAQRWPCSRLIGVDSDPAMLARAHRDGPDAEWIQADIADWQPRAAPDVIFSNAALHWLPGHATLLPRLLGMLADGGALAVQMPRNHAAPSHVLLRETAEDGPWAAALNGVLEDAPVAAPETYARWLTPHATRLDIWETTYLHRLTGADPVLSWVRGSALRPVLDRLSSDQANKFERDYAARLRDAYPPEPDGITLFPFRRLFIIALR